MGKLKMINVGDKKESKRLARARAVIKMKPDTLKLLKKGKLEKGDALLSAKLSGIIAAKETPRIIPLCHPVSITWADISFSEITSDSIEIISTVESCGRTGVEMEALTAAAVSALTIYDMAKPVDKSMKIKEIYLLEKRGGKSGTYIRKQSK